MTEESTTTPTPKLADTWEDEGHLFCGSHRPIECLLCGIKHSKWKGEPCESNKEGVWTEKGIDYILTSLREADDWETRRIVNQTAEVIMQLQKALEATEAERAKRDRAMAERLDGVEERVNTMFFDLMSGKTDFPQGGSIFLTLRALCINTLHFTAEELRKEKAAALKEQERGK